MSRQMLGVATAIAVLAGCAGSSERTKAGGEHPGKTKPKTLTFATFDEALQDNKGLPAFVEAVRRRSGGRLKIEVRRLDPAKVPNRVDPVRQGNYDLTFAYAGEYTDEPPALAALALPLLVDSPSLYEPLLDAGLDDLVFERAPKGLEGIGFMWGEPLLPWARDAPVLTRADFERSRGTAALGYSSRRFRESLNALGLKVEEMKQAEYSSVAGGPSRFRDAERPLVELHSETLAKFNLIGQWQMVGTLNLPLAGESALILGSERRLARLSSQELGWLRAAGRDAAQASLAQSRDDAQTYAKLCKAFGLRLALARPEDVQSMRDEVLPAYRADGDVRAVVELVEKVRGEDPPTLPDVPQECSGPPPARPAPVRRNRDPAALNGVYRFDVTAEEYMEAGYHDPVSAKANEGIITMTLRNGVSRLQLRERGADPSGQGIDHVEDAYNVDGRRATFFSRVGPVTVTWRKEPDGSLRFEGDFRFNPVAEVTWGKLWKRVR